MVNAQTVQRELTEPREGVSLDVYDRTTGILIGDVADAQSRKVGALEGVDSIGSKLYDSAQSAVAIVIGVERRKGDRVLPFAYSRVALESPVQSGTLLFDSGGLAVAFYYVHHDLAPGQGYIVPVQAVMRAHSDYVQNGSISRSWAGLIVTSNGTVPEVSSVRPDSPAALAGIKRGDILTQVGIRKVSSYLEVVDAFYYLIPGVTETFRVLRDGKPLSMQVKSVSRDSLY